MIAWLVADAATPTLDSTPTPSARPKPASPLASDLAGRLFGRRRAAVRSASSSGLDPDPERAAQARVAPRVRPHGPPLWRPPRCRPFRLRRRRDLQARCGRRPS
ncbi:hypothetical protein ACP4OV_015045 [Aristida adscensionis]